MGDVQATIARSNPRQPNLHPLQVTALADTGALMLCIPEHVVVQLQLEQESLREVTVADGRVMQVSYVGPVRVAFEGRSCFVPPGQRTGGQTRFTAQRQDHPALADGRCGIRGDHQNGTLFAMPKLRLRPQT